MQTRGEEIRCRIRGELMLTGTNEEKVYTALGISKPCWYARLRDPDSWRAGEIRIMRRFVSDETADMITR